MPGWEPDVLSGYWRQMFGLGPDPDGEGDLVATLVRRGEPDEPVLRAEGLELDLVAHQVTVNGDVVHLTPTEYELLRVLMQNRGRLMTHRALLGEVWGPGFEDDTQVLRVHVANLRRKIEPAPSSPRHVLTDPGIGYRFGG